MPQLWVQFWFPNETMRNNQLELAKQDLEKAIEMKSDYGEAYRNVMEHLRKLTDQIEQISIDEAFVDITKLPESSQRIAQCCTTFR